MGKLAFFGKGKYTDFSKGYSLYCNRCRKSIPVDEKLYSSLVKDYCKYLAERFEVEGMVDFPHDNGTLFVSLFRRKPQYRGDKFIGYGSKNWKTGEYDGSSTAFGVIYLPKRNKNHNMRSFGYVANRRLFERLKTAYMNQTCDWVPMMFNEKMI